MEIKQNKYKDIYCDNAILRQHIVDAKPSKNGLYPHEIIMIIRAEMGHLKTANTIFGGLFNCQYKVNYPDLLLKSLIDRGYIKESTPSELLDNIGITDLCVLKKNKNLILKGVSSKENLRILVSENYIISEIPNVLKFNLYLPTELGQEEIDDNKYLKEHQYGAWSLNFGHKKYQYVLSKKIKLVKQHHLDLHISKSDFLTKLGFVPWLILIKVLY